MVFEEDAAMTDVQEQPNPDVIDRLAAPEVRSNLRAIFGWIKGITLMATIVGSVPTVITAYYWMFYDIPWGKVAYYLEQYNLYKVNIGCNPNFKALDPSDNLQVNVGQCPSKDIMVRVKDVVSNRSAEQYIAFSSLEKPAQTTAGLLDALVPAAEAAVQPRDVASGGAGPRLRLAQAPRYEIVCQSLQSGGRIVRVVKEGGTCYLETYAVYRGRVEKREVAPCDTKCPK
jgi:hypothetical protein